MSLILVSGINLQTFTRGNHQWCNGIHITPMTQWYIDVPSLLFLMEMIDNDNNQFHYNYSIHCYMFVSWLGYVEVTDKNMLFQLISKSTCATIAIFSFHNVQTLTFIDVYRVIKWPSLEVIGPRKPMRLLAFGWLGDIKLIHHGSIAAEAKHYH